MESIKMQKLLSSDSNFKQQLSVLLQRDSEQSSGIVLKVQQILDIVKQEGDAALVRYCKKFDNIDVSASGFEITSKEINAAKSQLKPSQLEALQSAAERIQAFHLKQTQESWSYQEEDGSVFGQKVTPLKRAGVYVPGGKASYPSSVLMSAIPAKVAGVEEVVMVTPTPNGIINPLVLAAAQIADVDKIYRIGGAQAIGALAYGTQTIQRVDKITGPGNAYVAAAKQQVFGHVGIDMVAGPSEVLIIADETANPEWVAMDLFAQAEHDEMAQSILLTQDAEFVGKVEIAMGKQLADLPRKEIIEQSLQNNGAIIIVKSRQELIDVADEIAAEHLEIAHKEADQLAQEISHAGAIFIGNYSAESLGDYCAGPSHVLPTNGTARFSSPLGVYDFQKKTSIIKVSERGAHTLAKTATELAESESLEAHAKAAALRG